MKIKLKNWGGGVRKILFLSIVIFAWIHFTSAQNNTPNIFVDSDQDGMTDQEEMAIGTDARNADTDGDGYKDGEEVKAGYNPLKPAPGDKIVLEENQPADGQIAAADQEPKENLTDKFMQKLLESKSGEIGLLQEFTANPDEFSQDEDKADALNNISLTEEELQNMLNEVVDQSGEAEKMEMLPESEIKVMPRPEGKDEAAIKEKEKTQIEQYFTQVGYIALKYAPFQMDNENQLQEKTLGFMQEISSLMGQGDVSKLASMKENGQKCLDELKQVPAPFVLKDVHLSTLSIVNYMLKQNPNALVDENDPLNSVLVIGKMQSAAAEIERLGTEVEKIMADYNITTLKGAGSAGTATTPDKYSD